MSKYKTDAYICHNPIANRGTYAHGSFNMRSNLEWKNTFKLKIEMSMAMDIE